MNLKMHKEHFMKIRTLSVVLAIGMLLMMLMNCGTGASPQVVSPIVGPVWRWTSSQFNNGATQTVDNPNAYTLQFMADGQVQIKADCNTGGMGFKLNGNNIEFEPIRLTLIACPPGSLDSVFTQQLQTVGSYLTSGSELVLNIQTNTGRMIFTSAQVAAPTSVALETATPIRVTVTPNATVEKQTVTPLPATATPAPNCPGAPTIEFFRADQATIVRGQNTVLRWGQVLGATQVAIDHDIGGVAAPGSTIVAPQTTTTYTMTATGCGGTVQVPTQVTVLEPTGVPPTQVPPTPIPPTAIPPTDVPPTDVPTSVPDTNFVGTTWRWLGLVAPTGSQDNRDAARYTILFNADNTLAVRADCNTGNGTYTRNGNALTITLGVVTQVQCEEGSLSQQFLSLLQMASTYSIQNQTLSIALENNNGTMTFEP